MVKYTAVIHAKYVSGMDVHEKHKNGSVEAVYLAMFSAQYGPNCCFFFAKYPVQLVVNTLSIW